MNKEESERFVAAWKELMSRKPNGDPSDFFRIAGVFIFLPASKKEEKCFHAFFLPSDPRLSWLAFKLLHPRSRNLPGL